VNKDVYIQNEQNQTKSRFNRGGSPPTTSGLETASDDYSGRMGRDGRMKRIGKANKKRKKGRVKKSKR